jgi:ABC-type Fe3+ transport system substrate-binding protein
MTFDEWIVKKGHDHCWADMTKRAARAAWAAADQAAREECATICEQYAHYHANEGESAKAESWLILQCAAKIRETIK